MSRLAATANGLPAEAPSPLARWLGRLGSPAMLAGIVVLFATVPLVFVLYSSAQLTPTEWRGLWSNRLPGLLGNTLSLAVLVGVTTVVLGVSSAWLVARRRFVGRRLATWLMVLPLAIPTYVFAHIYTSLLESDGWLGRLWMSVFGTDAPDIYNIGGATLVLSLAGFSYIFLLVRMALGRSSHSLEEAARIQGLNARQVFRRVSLPLLRPAIAAGLAVVVLHVLSDFGGVSMLRYQTFTLAIYLQMSGRFDYLGAAGLSLVLVFLSLTFLVLERFFRRRQRYYYTGAAQGRRAPLRRASPLEQLLIWGWLGLIALLSFGLPMAWLVTWSRESWMRGLIGTEFWGYVLNSISVGLAAATVAVLIALPISLYHVRRRNLLSGVYVQLSSVGFVLPGPVIALGILTFVLALPPQLGLYGGFAALIMALVIRFLPLSVQSQESALQQLTPSIEDAGRILGAGPLENLRRVILPMMKGGLASAWVLVFIDAMKELPATLLLRPTGFDTLPVRIWIEASEEMLELAAPAALMLVVGTLPAVWMMMRSR